jgi:hypothetical protein
MTTEDRLSDLVKNSVSNALTDASSQPYLSPADYHQKTGKRFRMTRDQKASGMPREQAFQEFLENLARK